ncbi:unnamed protein product [Rotaria sp. Silwood1]|nr:unnamed protein product [Rotaria sp. Silwood1]
MAFGTNPFELHASNFLKQIRQKRQTKFNYGEIYGLPLSYGVTLPQSCCTSDVPTTFNSLDSYCISNANNMPNSFHTVGCLKILSKVAGDQTLGIAIINSCLLAFALAAISILYGFDTLIGGPRHRSNDSRQTIERLLSNNAMEQTIHPEFLRLVPPLHECTIDELVWLSPIDCDPSLFTWDSTMCIANTINHEIRQLMDKAYQGALNLQQQQKLLDELDNDPNLVYHIGLVPSKLPILVENSPLISIQCLLKLISSNQMTEYLSSLLNMDMSLHSMEVVNRLSTSMELPQEFLHLYISTCIKTCEETKDKYLQNRFVRLVSVFIQSLIRNKVIDIKDLFLDIQGFCINFRHIREAGALFQLVKSFDLRNNDTNETITPPPTTTTMMISTPLTANDE